MQFTGTERITAARDRVWVFLMDPNRVAACGPGVESVEVVDADHFRVRAKVSVGFISARFMLDMAMAERVEPDVAVIRARGQAPGSAVEGQARMVLSGQPEGPTDLAWTADVTITGTLAAVGRPLIEGTAKKIIAQVFTCFRSQLEAGE